MSITWNPWHGCQKISTGCQNCYVYRMDERYDRNSQQVSKNACFDLLLKKKRDGSWKVPPGEMVYTCFTSDFFLDAADAWRPEVWAMMRERSDLSFLFITKRIHRFAECIPEDWGSGYPNVHICCTVENQAMTDYRLPLFKAAPIRYKSIVCSPLLGPIDLTPWLDPSWVCQVTVGGESGLNARVCHYDWILSLHRQCVDAGVAFHFQQTGARLIKDHKLYRIRRKDQHSQARKAGINYTP
ncbi:DUF5131 family protein [Eubacterium sp. 1001713B170207_170306_E7]|uniref:DUF5131 family protein n=1 Tax=Eubacterium sp. 1001713B170207_170306_E7 TaxID=2787097 RepID=UPI00189B8C35|nr:DUF5131 family protein [Eubacterium sp. 1001713B170207_170306_E7]